MGGCSGCGEPGMPSCGSASDAGCGGGGCGACCGKGDLLLGGEELELLLLLGHYAFLPLIQISRDSEPYFMPAPAEAARFGEDFHSLALSLEQKGLISLDPAQELRGADYGSVPEHLRPRFGSLALTKRGQESLDWLDPALDCFE